MNKDLELLQHQMSNMLYQKQQVQQQIFEIESALEELKESDTTYKIVGSIMIKKDASSLKKELEEKLATMKMRLDAFVKQEQETIKKLEDLQKSQ